MPADYYRQVETVGKKSKQPLRENFKMSDDILDLFAGKYKSSTNSSNKSTGNTTSSLQNSSKTKKPEPVPNAPIELMSQVMFSSTSFCV